MKSDLDHLMAERAFNGLLILGSGHRSYLMKYFLADADLGETTIIKKRNDAPVIICNPMEREEAIKSGLIVETTSLYSYAEIIKEKGSYFDADIELLSRIIRSHDLKGTIAVYGEMDAGKAYILLQRLSSVMPDVTFVGETDTSIFDEAFATKSPDELEAIKDAAATTHIIFSEVMDMIASHQIKDDHLINTYGAPLTIGDVKAFAATRLAYHGMEEEGGLIFAIGRDAGIPHSRGTDSDALTLGKTIVFDFFPYSRKTGYFHDMTRTFCLGYASPEIEAAYKQVEMAFQAVFDNIRLGEKASHYQDIVCEVFEDLDHPTPRTKPGTEEGYVHSVGHGLGLQIHSRPRFSAISQDIIRPWQVFTIEPGLYYPERGYGIRLEDTVYVDDVGKVHSLTPYPKELVFGMKTE